MKISELARAADVNIETVRYYQRVGVLDIPIAKIGYRQYSQDHINQMRFIKNAKSAGFSLKEIREFMRFDAVQDKVKIRRLSEQKKAELKVKLSELSAMVSFLDSLIKDCKKSDSKYCPIIDRLNTSQ